MYQITNPITFLVYMNMSRMNSLRTQYQIMLICFSVTAVAYAGDEMASTESETYTVQTELVGPPFGKSGMYRKKIAGKRINIKKDIPTASPFAGKKRFEKRRDLAMEKILKKKISDMNIEELRGVKEYVLSFGNIDWGKKMIDRMIRISDDQEEVRRLRLELADILFDEGKMKQAAKVYHLYIKLYPGSKNRDEIEYKEILARFYARSAPPRDQSSTKKAYRLAHVYLNTHSGEKKYMQEVQKIAQTCQTDMYSAEIDVLNQYYTRNQFTGAHTRLAHIEKEFLPAMKHIEPELIEWKIALAEKQGHTEIVAESMETLKQKFPEHETTVIAFNADNKPKKKKSYVSLF